MILRTTLWRTIVFKAFLFCAIFGCSNLRAQYVAIPDSGFAVWLNVNYPLCMHADSLDTTCNAVLTAKSLNTSYYRISSLEGAQYFKSLDSLKCNADTTLTYIPALARTLRVLECRNDSLTSLPALPDSLYRLECEFNVLGSLPTLPASLRTLSCYNNQLTSLPALPAGLRSLYCSGNKIDSLPALSDSLIVLSCYANRLIGLPALKNVLRDLICNDNTLEGLPALPASLRNLDCYSNWLYSIPTLPDSLRALSCSYNRLNALPALPRGLTMLNCEYNKITSLPQLPDSLFQLFIDNNPNLRCLPLLNTIVDFEFYNTGIACLPNVGNVYISNPDTLNICDSTFNPYGCLQINAVKEIAKPSFSIYPNPAKAFFTITVDDKTVGGNMRLVSNTGQVIRTLKLQQVNSTIETNNLAAGLYIVLINDPQGLTAVSKLVIE